ncbi:MAG: aspartate-semialdehyde dehydrogenase [Bifidobacteriaceae bacterium]|nr:aspartate-semialdehyde dehydrogenase [Bifidobacteriaceae bacterium]
MKKEYCVAILGATGAVGTRMIQQLEKSKVPVGELKLLASKKSAGMVRKVLGRNIAIQEADENSFDAVDIVLASAGGTVSKKLLPAAVNAGAVCIDNSSEWRLHDDVPLVVPEVNADELEKHHGIIGNPNCSTIQMVVALEPIRRAFGVKKIVVSTYQAAGGAGQSAIDELQAETSAYVLREKMHPKILPTKFGAKHYPLAFNLLPQIDAFDENGYTKEELKMIYETKKILCGDKNSSDINVTATCVRVPVMIGHGESVYFETADSELKPPTANDIRELLRKSPGIVIQDDISEQLYPQPLTAEGKTETFVGRIRVDLENPRAFNMWIVADNLLKGAATNAVQIAEELIARELLQ